MGGDEEGADEGTPCGICCRVGGRGDCVPWACAVACEVVVNVAGHEDCGGHEAAEWS